jgi:hypothetical protein
MSQAFCRDPYRSLRDICDNVRNTTNAHCAYHRERKGLEKNLPQFCEICRVSSFLDKVLF